MVESKGEETLKENRICWFICFVFIFIISLVIIILSALILREVKNSDDCASASGSNSLSDESLSENIQNICYATCRIRAQNTVHADMSPVFTSDTGGQSNRCRECCTQLTQQECESLDIIDMLPQPPCEWVVVDDGGGGCVSQPGSQVLV